MLQKVKELKCLIASLECRLVPILRNRHPSGKLIATFWSLSHENKWSLIETIQTSHTKSLRCVKFSHNGQSIAITSFDTHISIFIKGEQGYEQLQLIEGPQNQVKCVDWSPKDKHLATCSRDKIVWIWSFNPTHMNMNVILHQKDIIIWLSQSSLASCSYDNTIRIWQQNDDDFEQDQVLEGHDSIVWSIAYDQKTKLFIFGWRRQENSWMVTQLKEQQIQLNFSIGQIHAFPIYTCCLLTPNILVTGSGDNSLALVKTGSKEQQYLIDRKYHEGDVNCVRCWIGENSFIASVGDDEKLIIWKVNFN